LVLALIGNSALKTGAGDAVSKLDENAYRCGYSRPAPEGLLDNIPKVNGLSMAEHLEIDMKTLLAFVLCGVDSHDMSVYDPSFWRLPTSTKHDPSIQVTQPSLYRQNNIKINFQRFLKAEGEKKGHLAAQVTAS
jgi:hypothetical protein